MRTWLSLLLLLASGMLPVCGREDPWYTDLAVDGDGRVWARVANGSDVLGQLIDGKWESLPEQNLPSYSPQALFALRNGSIGCFWNGQAGWCFCTHRIDRPPKAVTFDGPFGTPILHELSDGTLLITEHSLRGKEDARLTLIPPKGEPVFLTVPEEWLQHPPDFDPDHRYFAPICATEDATHRIWLWSYPFPEGTSEWLLPSFVALKDGRLEKLAIPGVAPTDRITGMVSMDEGHLWYAKLGAGIFSLDLKTLESTLLTQPLPARNGTDNVQYIQQLFREGDDCFALTCPRPWDPIPPRGKDELEDFYRIPPQRATWDTLAPHGRLLRHRQGEWEEILTGIDQGTEYRCFDRPHQMTSAGLLIGSVGSGPWLTLRPGGKPPVHLDWKSGFPLDDARRMHRAGKDKVRMLSSTGATAEVAIDSLGESRASTVRESWVMTAPIADAQGNLWAFRTRTSLGKWDGRQWMEVAPPKPIKVHYEDSFFWGDDLQQGWLMDDQTGSAAVVDFATGQWKTYTTWEASMTAQLPRGPSTARAEIYGPPVYSGHGEIAFLRWGEALHLYDGAAWRKWKLPEITAEKVTYPRFPFFDAQHQLCLDLSEKIHVWDATAARWTARDRLPADPPLYRTSDTGPVQVPEGCTVTDAFSLAKDALGTTWIMTRRGQLSKFVPGRTVPVLAEGEPTPFGYHLPFKEVQIDPLGGATIQLESWGEPVRLLQLPAKLPLPETSAVLVEKKGDSVRVQFSVSSSPPKEVWYAWQLDAGLWQPVQQETELTLRDLPAGAHRLQVRAYNAGLGGDRTPAVLEWESEAGTTRPPTATPLPPPPAAVARVAERASLEAMAARISDLSAPTREKREAAAKFLRAQGAAALPLLKEIRERGAPDGLWWINKVIEEIEADLRP